MKTVNIHAAKTQLSALVEEALDGEEIIIAKAGKPLVRLTPLMKKTVRRRPGAMKGMIRMSDDFDAPLPPDLARAFGAEE
jgi:prevent-host-death family protein